MKTKIIECRNTTGEIQNMIADFNYFIKLENKYHGKR